MVPFRGHVNPIIGLGQELVSRGCKVTFPISNTKTKWVDIGGIEPLGIEILSEKGEIDEMSLNNRQQITNSDSSGFISKITKIYSILNSTMIEDFINVQKPILRYAIEENRKGNYAPDIIVTERMCQLCASVADLLEIPYLNFNPSLLTETSIFTPAFSSGFSIEMTQIERIINSIRISLSKFKFFIYFFMNSKLEPVFNDLGVEGYKPIPSYLRDDSYELVATCFGFDYPRPLLPTTKLVGPLIPTTLVQIDEKINKWLNSDESAVIYLCMGTVTVTDEEIAKKFVNIFIFYSFL